MGNCNSFRWTGPLVAALLVAFTGCALAESKMNAEPSAEALKEFKSAGLASDGWFQFVYAGKLLKFRAPSPAVPLLGAEKARWGWDVATFKFSRLQDRQVLYLYDLSNEKTAEAVINALDATRLHEKTAIWTAIGVEYDTSEFTEAGYADLFRRAAVPVMWNEASSAFVKGKYNPNIFAKAVGLVTSELSAIANDNFDALDDWSALAKKYNKKLAKDMKGHKIEGLVATAAAKGPLTWLTLSPISSFIAVNRDLEISGIEPLRILTSKTAWETMSK